MASYKVGIARCENYEPHTVQTAVSTAVSLAGGLPEIFASAPALVKVNLLAPRKPEDAVTTHPEVVRGAVKCLRAKNAAHIRVADNPGYVFDAQKDMLFEKTGMDSLREEGVSVGLLSEGGLAEKKVPGSKVLASVRVPGGLLEAQCVLNIPKLKTHIETEMSGCLKNMFGAADTDTRKRAHMSPDKMHLVDAILDIYSARVPDFHIMDAAETMEGNGPSHGAKRRSGWIVAGDNGLAVDMIAALIMNYKNPLQIPLLSQAAIRGMGPQSPGQIELLGADMEDLPIEGYRRATRTVQWIPTPVRGFVHNWVRISPRLVREACVKCKICQKVCPVDAIKWDGLPVIDTHKCVRCLCCHEMCPPGAMEISPNLLTRIIQKIRS